MGRASISVCPRGRGGAGRTETSFLQTYFSSEDDRLKILKIGYFKVGVFLFVFVLVKLKTGISALNTECQKCESSTRF